MRATCSRLPSYLNRIFFAEYTLSSLSLAAVSISYIYIPVIIFLLGWVKIYIAVPIIAAGALISYFFFNNLAGTKRPKRKSNEFVFDGRSEVKLSVGAVILIATGVVILAHYCGWDGFAPQAGDWKKHNAVLHDLMEYSWPVYYQKHDNAMLTYYIGQYLLPALAGKIFGSFKIAYAVMLVWNCLGVYLVLGWVFILSQAVNAKKQIICFFLLFFFSGMLIVAQFLLLMWNPENVVAGGNHYCFLGNGMRLQYRSFFVALRWVPPQFIVPSLGTALWIKYRKKENYYVYLILPVLLFGTFQFLGLAAAAVMYAATSFVSMPYRVKFNYIKKVLSPFNILWAVTLGAVFILYFWGNITGEKEDSIRLGIYNFLSDGQTFTLYLIFCVFMFGIYAALIYPMYRKNKVYICSVILLILIPWFHMGKWNDFCMCVSMIPQFAIFVFILGFLFKKSSGKRILIAKTVLSVLLCLGALTSVAEISIVIKGDEPGIQKVDYYTLADFTDRSNPQISPDEKYNYYTYDIEDDIFINYIASKVPE